jgi:stage V sporulation protein B
LATTIASFIMMIPMFLLQFRLTKTHAPYVFLAKVTIASIIMALPVLVLPSNSYGLIAGLIICPIIYMIAIVALRTLSHEDVAGFRKFTRKLGPLKDKANKFLDFLDKYSSDD